MENKEELSDVSDNSTVGLEEEVREYLATKVVRRRLFPRAVLVGVLSGTVAVCFRLALHFIESWRMWFTSQIPQNPVLVVFVVALIASAGILLALFIGKIDPNSGGSGIPHMKAVLEGHASLNWARLLWVKFTASLVALGSGLVMGREGPTVQMGGAVGTAVSDFTQATGRERRALIASGAGAGLAAAFNAPLAGVTFVLEELQRDFQPVVFGASLLSAAVATVISRLVSGQVSIFNVPPIPAPSLMYIPLFVLMGVFGGVLGVIFNRGLLDSQKVVGKWKKKSTIAVACVIGVMVGLAYLVSPLLLGGGHALSEAALHGEILLWPAIAYLIIRLLLVHFCYATGAPGGIFAPLLSLGAVMGVAGFHITQLIVPSNGISVAACAVAGMCALFSGVVRAPLTAIILIGEMTGSYDLLLPLLIAAFTAYSVSEGLKDTPIYEALLQRDAAKNGWKLIDDEPLTAEFEVRSGAPYEGKEVKDLGLPEGVLIVLCKAEGKEFVPNGSTVLHQHMKVVVATGTPEDLHEVQRGVTGLAPDEPSG